MLGAVEVAGSVDIAGVLGGPVVGATVSIAAIVVLVVVLGLMTIPSGLGQ